jgi:putative tryptophan/tyrosine transport system substrate-binding protein
MTTLSRRQVVQGAGVVGLGLLAGCGRWPWQASDRLKVYRIGYLDPGVRTLGQRSDREDTFLRGLSDLGYVEGSNLVIESRYAEQQVERLPELATELVQLPVDVLVAVATAAQLAAQRVTSTVPIVMATSADPVGVGLVSSLARPGGNVTGMSNLLPQMSAKRLELLKETVPGLTRVAILWTAANPGTVRQAQESQAAAYSLGLHPISLEAQGPTPAYDRLFEIAARDGAEALVVVQDPLFVPHTAQIVELAVAAQFPTMYAGRTQVVRGGLMSYGASVHEQYYRAAYYVDRILKGAKPADLPVEQPREFECVINLKTAHALGLTIPHHVLLQATEVI